MLIPIEDQIQYFSEDRVFEFSCSENEIKEIANFLYSKNAEFTNDGTFSIVFKSENYIYVVCCSNDMSKEILIAATEKIGYEYLPKISRLFSTENFVIYEEEILDVFDFDMISNEKEKIVAPLVKERFCNIFSFLLTDVFNSLSEDLQSFFISLAEKLSRYDIELDFNYSNIGWRNNTPVFFDILLPA